MKTQGVGNHLYMSLRETWNRSFPHSPQKEPTLKIPLPWISNHQKCEKTDCCCLRHPACITIMETLAN